MIKHQPKGFCNHVHTTKLKACPVLSFVWDFTFLKASNPMISSHKLREPPGIPLGKVCAMPCWPVQWLQLKRKLGTERVSLQSAHLNSELLVRVSHLLVASTSSVLSQKNPSH